MTDLDFSKNSTDDRVLLISFDNKRPMRAAQVAVVLRALDGDYREMTGRALVLAHLEIGSTWIWLADIAVTAATWIKDVAEVTKASEDLGSFATKLKNAFKPKKGVVAGHDLSISDNSVDKSIVAMAKVSEQTKSTIRIKKTFKTDAGVETLEIEITPAQAKEARKRVRKRPRADKVSSLLVSPTPDVDVLARVMRDLPPATGDIEAVILAIVQAHMTQGSTHVLEQVATTLDHNGRSDVAIIIRRLLGPGRGHVRVEV